MNSAESNSNSRRDQYERFVNRVEGVHNPVMLIASHTFPVGVRLKPEDFAQGPLIAAAADLKTTVVRHFESLLADTPQECEGAWVALSVLRGSVADDALSLLIRGEHVSGEGGEPGQTIMGEGVGRVSLAITFADGSTADFTTGVLLHVFDWNSDAREFLFHFSQINRDY